MSGATQDVRKPADALTLELAGEQVWLLPQKAVYWPREAMLVIADIHFGKAAAFRSFGIPVPRGTTSENLDALDALIDATGARHVLFLGDFLHARASHAAGTQAAMLAWRQRRAELALTLVRGNHDKHAGDPAAALGIDLVDEPHALGPFSFCHHPDLDLELDLDPRADKAAVTAGNAADSPAGRAANRNASRTAAGTANRAGYVLAGHVHPAYVLATRFDTLRLPCFVVGPGRMILPSFGAFTGGHTVRPGPGERIFVTSGEAVHSVR